MRFLLDTNILSDIVRNSDGRAAKRFETLKPGEGGTSIIAAAEMRFGYIRLGSKKLEKRVEGILSTLEIKDWVAPADFAYANLRAVLEKSGTTVGQNDMLIAAHAAALNVILVSDDRIFSRVPGLKVENWRRDEPAAS